MNGKLHASIIPMIHLALSVWQYGNNNDIVHINYVLNFDHFILASIDEATDKNISPTTETNFSSGTSSGCGNLIAYLVAPLVAVFLP